ncbi:MAG: PilZ domain-containing protein [Candidatus Delongbacteria bacterium]|nr:PilZ domain-containing protein [Candidatus Delongbacteria bacterium]
MTEQRFFTRVDLDTIILFEYNDKKLKGNVVDVSVSGVLIDLDDEISLNKDTEYTIDLFIPNSTIVLKAKVKMIRQQEKFYGLQFVDLDLGTMFLINTLSSFKKIEIGKYYSTEQIADVFEMDNLLVTRHFPDEKITGEQLIEFMDKMYERLNS